MKTKSEMKRLAHQDPQQIIKENLDLRSKLNKLIEALKRLINYCEVCDNEGVIEENEAFSNAWGEHGLKEEDCPNCVVYSKKILKELGEIK